MTTVMYNTILIGIDGSGHADEAVKVAAALARAPANITVVHVINEKSHRELEEFGRIEHIDVTAPAVIIGQQLLGQTVRALQSHGHEAITTTLREGETATEILSYASEIMADLIVLGCRGLRPSIRSSLGSVSSAVLHRAPCTCIAVRGPDA